MWRIALKPAENKNLENQSLNTSLHSSAAYHKGKERRRVELLIFQDVNYHNLTTSSHLLKRTMNGYIQQRKH